MADFERAEVEAHQRRWRACVDRRDLEGMRELLAPDARGGNAVFGIVEGRDAIIDFAATHWPESVPNREIWCAIDGARVVSKWRETLPGEPPAGTDYDYTGISEFIYAGDGVWSFMYGIPDVVGLQRVHARWRADGQADVHGEVYPGFAD